MFINELQIMYVSESKIRNGNCIQRFNLKYMHAELEHKTKQYNQATFKFCLIFELSSQQHFPCYTKCSRNLARAPFLKDNVGSLHTIMGKVWKYDRFGSLSFAKKSAKKIEVCKSFSVVRPKTLGSNQSKNQFIFWATTVNPIIGAAALIEFLRS